MARLNEFEGGWCAPGGEAAEGCITCGDVAVPLRVVLIDAERELALCEDDAGRRESVEIALVQPVLVGDELLVHAGTAIAHAMTAAPSAVEQREGSIVDHSSTDDAHRPQGEARGDAVMEGSP